MVDDFTEGEAKALAEILAAFKRGLRPDPLPSNLTELTVAVFTDAQETSHG